MPSRTATWSARAASSRSAATRTASTRSARNRASSSRSSTVPAVGRRGDPRGARVLARARGARDPGRAAARRRRRNAARAWRLSVRALRASRRSLARARHRGGAAMDGPLSRRACMRVGAPTALRGATDAVARADSARESVDDVLATDWIPAHLVESYEASRHDLLDAVERAFIEVGATTARFRIHGDCHRGNVLWTDAGPALRRSRRLHERPGRPGPVAVPVGVARGNGRSSSAICSRATASSAISTYRELATDRGAAGAAHDALHGLDRAALGRSGIPAGVSVVRESRATGSSTCSRSRSSGPRSTSPRSQSRFEAGAGRAAAACHGVSSWV